MRYQHIHHQILYYDLNTSTPQHLNSTESNRTPRQALTLLTSTQTLLQTPLLSQLPQRFLFNPTMILGAAVRYTLFPKISSKKKYWIALKKWTFRLYEVLPGRVYQKATELTVLLWWSTCKLLCHLRAVLSCIRLQPHPRQPQHQEALPQSQPRESHHSPTMSMPVSIGDILLLSKIAYQIGVAFTSGRKSAPREFAEVENQLFALSTALEVLTQYIAKNRWYLYSGGFSPLRP